MKNQSCAFRKCFYYNPETRISLSEQRKWDTQKFDPLNESFLNKLIYATNAIFYLHTFKSIIKKLNPKEKPFQ